MKTYYSRPEMEVLRFVPSDIIRTSSNESEDDWNSVGDFKEESF